jgi:hypothetical protein
MYFPKQAAGAVFAVLLLLFSLEDADSFAGEIKTVNIFGIENIAKFVTGKTMNTYLFMTDPVSIYLFYLPYPALTV